MLCKDHNSVNIKPGKIDSSFPPLPDEEEKLTNRVCWDIILKLIERRSVPILKR